MLYTELQVTSNFSFLQGASHPEEMVEAAVALGYTEMAITDVNTLAGIVRAHSAAKKRGLRIIPGCQLQLQDGPSLLVYPTTLKGYASLCELLTIGNLRTTKGNCVLHKADVFAMLKEVIIIVLPPDQLNENGSIDNEFKNALIAYKQVFGNEIYLAAQRRYNGQDAKMLFCLSQLSTELHIPLVATNNVFYHEAARRQLQDVVTCIREKCTIYNAGFKLYANAERYLKDEAEMIRLFRQYPAAIACTQEIVAACTFSLDELKYEYPEEITTGGRTPDEELIVLAWEGATAFYGDTIPEKIINSINHELRFIKEMNYAAYFLTVYDIVKFARSKNILCQGRGSAANSTVCFCLGITCVNPDKFELLFERFISAARNEPPDIDVDFEHERREEVIQYIYEKYGRERAAIVATVTQQHQKGAIRDVAKAMGLSIDTINKISSTIHRLSSNWFSAEMIAEAGLDINDQHLKKTFELGYEFIGFPRQLGQHTGGFVINRYKLSNLCPVLNARMQNRTCIEWNKDDIDALGFLKIDVLALGMLTCIRKAFDLIEKHYGIAYALATIPQDDPAVYDMICNADTIGVFQIESRAQQSMLPRLKPRCFYDLVIEVAIVRPGPIQGDMVHPYLRRRNGEEAVEYPSPALKEILERTLGVPLFQEQAMKIAIVAAGFTPSEADELRRSMATFKIKGEVTKLQHKLISGMIANGYTPEYAQRVFKQLEGFGSYGFPESHAASFAQLVYVSSWIKCHYPDVFAAALLNSLPMGFYQPAQIVIDATNHGVHVQPVDINYSLWDNLLEKKTEKYFTLRLGFRNIKGISAEDVALFITARKTGFVDIHSVLQANIAPSLLEKLADADAFRSIGLDRRQALWELSIKDKPIALFAQSKPIDEKAIQLPLMGDAEHVLQDYATVALSLKAHPVSFIREKLNLLHCITHAALAHQKNGAITKVAGMVLVRQSPGTAKGVWFITLEDETGICNIVMFPNIAEEHKRQVLQSRLLLVEGKVQVAGKVIHVMATKCFDITPMLAQLRSASKRSINLPALSKSDEAGAIASKDTRDKDMNDLFKLTKNFQ
jgi:error-prone DNA polymerase